MVSLNPYSLRVHFRSADLEHPIGRNPFFMTKDKVSLRISIDGLVRFCSPIDSLQVPQAWSSPCNNFTVKTVLGRVRSERGGNIVGHLLSGCFESSIIGKQEKTRPAIVTHTIFGRVAIDH